MEHSQIILLGLIALMGIIWIVDLQSYIKLRKYYNAINNQLDKLETDKDILIDEVKRLEKLNDANIVEIFELKSELSALKAKMPQQCGKCGKWTKPNPIIVEDKPMCQKCFAKRVEIETKQPEATKQNPAYEGSQNWAKEMLLNGKRVCNPIHFHDDTYWFMRDDLCVKVVGKTEEYATHIENVCALYHSNFNDGWKLFQNVAETNPLDLSNVKPGTKVRLSNGVETVTIETSFYNEVSVEPYRLENEDYALALYFRFDGTAVNGSDIRIVEVVE